MGSRPVSIGRSPSNDLVIPDPKASRHHARVMKVGDQYVLEDLESAHGCSIGGRRTNRHVLADRDEIQICDQVIAFHAVEDALPAADGSTAAQEQHLPSTAVLDPYQAGIVDALASREGARRLQALFEISRALEEATDLAAVLVQIIDKALVIMGAERGFLMLSDVETGELKVHVARDRTGDVVGLEREAVSRSLMAEVMRSKRPALVLDAQAGGWDSDSMHEHSIHAALCAPLMTADAVTGVVYVDHRSRPGAFTQNDLAFFTTFAIQAKAAIDGSRAYWELVESLFAASGDFIVVCTPDGRIKQVNRAGSTLVGLPAKELVGQELVNMVPPEDRQMILALVGETCERGVTVDREVGLRPPGASQSTPLSISTFALRDRTRRVIGLCLIGRDLSEVKGLIAGLTEANQALTVHNEFIRRTFGRYLSEEVVRTLLESPTRLELGGERRKVTILMSDLRGFTALSERVPPEEVLRTLNSYFACMVPIINAHGGTIDEIIGDAMLVIFGAPIAAEDDARRAAACALRMQLAMSALNAAHVASGLSPLEMAIAVTTGEVVVGNIGSQTRSKYAVVGTQVNRAARIQARAAGRQILISESTRLELGLLAMAGPPIELTLKGLKAPITVHDLEGLTEPPGLELCRRGQDDDKQSAASGVR